MFDLSSMTLGAAISGIALSLMMVALKAPDSSCNFKVSWALGVGLLVLHVLAYWFFSNGASIIIGALACALQPVAAAVLYASGRQFVDNEYRMPPTASAVSIPYLIVAPPLFAAGYDGVALVLQNAVTGTMLIMGGLAYLKPWREAPLAIGGLSALYMIAGTSFLLCGLVVLASGQWRIGYPPHNWAEELNVIISILALSAAGALTLSIDQIRLAKKSQLSAMSDPLTGLLNRRGLAAVRSASLRADEAVVLFDLDHFKQINDRYGHAVGDRVICAFADTLREHGRTTDAKARLGGEEFAMVMARVTPKQARAIARRVTEAFAAAERVTDDGEPFRCTVSAGVAFGREEGAAMDVVMTRADQALYAAKRAGRNRVEVEPPSGRPGLRLAG